MFILKLQLEKDGQVDHQYQEHTQMDKSVVISVLNGVQMLNGVPMYFQPPQRLLNADVKLAQEILQTIHL